MHEVRVYDGLGNLKKVISVKKLNIRSKKQLESPYLFRKDKRSRRPTGKTPKIQAKAE